MALVITEGAAKYISDLKSDGKISGTSVLRVGVRGGGCSGLTYDLDFTETISEHDKQFDGYGESVIVDKKSYLFVNGSEVQYNESLLHSGLSIVNPMATRKCGCGESFMV